MSTKKIVILYITAVIILVGGFWFLGHAVFGNLDEDNLVEFAVTENQGVSQIAQKLWEEKLIRSKTFFLLYLYFSGNFSGLKPGTYFLSRSLGVGGIVGRLLKGPLAVETVIYPGMTLKEIDDRLSEVGVLKKGELVNFNIDVLLEKHLFLNSAKNLEGFLMPDTYKFFQSSSPETVAEVFLDNFQKKTESLWSNQNDIYRTIIIASLVEKEVTLPDDKRIVAGIIFKRLSVGMPLQIDASVVYGVCQGKFLDCSPLTAADFKRDFPYNTYLYKGLPPGPIANPSLESIKMVLSPQKSSYLYYLSDPSTKKTVFSKTLEEHGENRARYLGL